MLDVTKATISAWESDKKLPESSRLPIIREVLEVSLDELFPTSSLPLEVREKRGGYDLRPSELDAAIAGLSSRQQLAVLELLRSFKGG